MSEEKITWLSPLLHHEHLLQVSLGGKSDVREPNSGCSFWWLWGVLQSLGLCLLLHSASN